MVHPTQPAAITHEPVANRADVVAKSNWENEGGSVPRPSQPAHESTVVGSAHLLDDRQDDLMSVASSEGRPPPRGTRVIQWRWFGAVVILLIAGVITWFFIDGMGTRILAIATAFTLLLIGGASPILGAGLLRGQEERAARRRAKVQLQPSPSS